MKILVIHQYYLPPGQAGGSRFNEFARYWQERGHQVTVIAGDLNYASNQVASESKSLISRRSEDDVDVLRCHVPRIYHRGYSGRALAFVAFFLCSLLAVVRAGRPDVIIATSPPLLTGLTGWFASVVWWRPWIFEIRDLWPESAITTNVISRTSLTARILFAIERWSCRRSSVVVVLTPAFAEDLERRRLVSRDRMLFVPNGADEALVPGPRDNSVRQALGWNGQFVAVYAGAHGRANAIQQLVDTAALLRHRNDILIVTVGDGPERSSCEQRAAGLGLTNIAFLGPRPKSEMPAILQAADVGLAVLQDNPTFLTVYPNKVFDYMATERPVVIAIDGVSRELVCEKAQAGLFATPEDAASIAACLESLADAPEACRRLGSNGRSWVLRHASRRALSDRYETALRAVASNKLPTADLWQPETGEWV